MKQKIARDEYDALVLDEIANIEENCPDLASLPIRELVEIAVKTVGDFYVTDEVLSYATFSREPYALIPFSAFEVQ